MFSSVRFIIVYSHVTTSQNMIENNFITSKRYFVLLTKHFCMCLLSFSETVILTSVTRLVFSIVESLKWHQYIFLCLLPSMFLSFIHGVKCVSSLFLFLSSIPLYECTLAGCFFRYSWYMGCFQFLTLMHMLLWTFLYKNVV